MEVELKLTLLDGAKAGLTRHRAIAGAHVGKPRRTREVTTYFDTDDLALAGEGVSLRVRRRGTERIQTLKSRGASAEIAMQRGEWEWQVAGDRPDLDRLAETPIGARLSVAPDSNMAPVLTTDIERTTWILTLDDGAVIEAALDDGTIAAGAASEPVRELELELKQGEPAALYRLALALIETTPLAIASESKADRGYRLRTGHAPSARKAKAARFPRDATTAQAFRTVLMSALGHLLANQPAAAAGDAEGVHQIRVAIRALRATMRLFRNLLDRDRMSGFDTELRRLGQVFGSARDLDVFRDDILPRALPADGDRGRRELLASKADRRRRDAYARVTDELRSPALTRLVLAMAAWAEDGAEDPERLGDARLAKPAVELAPDLLGRLARKVGKRGRRLKHRSGPELHALRKSVKKLRQGVTDLACLTPRQRTKDYVRACKDVLDRLGRLQDATMGEAHAERLAADDASLGPAVAQLTAWATKRRRKQMKRLPRAWRALREQPPAWA